MEHSSLTPSTDVGTFVPQTPISETPLTQDPTYFIGQGQPCSSAAQPQSFTGNAYLNREGNQFIGLSSPSDPLSTHLSDEYPGEMYLSIALEEFGYQYAYPQQGYPLYNPNFAGYFGFMNDPSYYYSDYTSPASDETQFEAYSGIDSTATSQYDGSQRFWQSQISENRFTRPQLRYRPVQRPNR